MEDLETKIGELLACGFTNDEIISEIQQGLDSREEAVTFLQNVYTGWQSTINSLELTEADFANWHVQLRMKLLKTALADNTLPSQKLGLQILDSLATIQGIGGETTGRLQPLNIILMPKETKSEE